MHSAKIAIFPNEELAETIFGPSTNIYGPLINSIAPKVLDVEYQFEDNEKFTSAALSGAYTPAQINQIYWREILLRAHMASAASLLRTCRWIDAVVRELAHSNLLGWTACCRGLLEAVGDTMDALGPVAPTLAEQHRQISSHLIGTDTGILNTCKDIEDALIHFTHARKIAKNETNLPDSHKAKLTREYISMLDRMKIPSVTNLYAELCGFTHPAQRSVLSMFVPVGGGESGKIEPNYDLRVIADLLGRHRQAFNELLMPAFNPILLTLRVLDHFDFFPHIDELRKINLGSISAWRKIEADLNH